MLDLDSILQDCEAITVLSDEKKSFRVPFTDPIKYSFKKLTDDFIFKFAVLQDGRRPLE